MPHTISAISHTVSHTVPWFAFFYYVCIYIYIATILSLSSTGRASAVSARQWYLYPTYGTDHQTHHQPPFTVAITIASVSSRTTLPPSYWLHQEKNMRKQQPFAVVIIMFSNILLHFPLKWNAYLTVLYTKACLYFSARQPQDLWITLFQEISANFWTQASVF